MCECCKRMMNMSPEMDLSRVCIIGYKVGKITDGRMDQYYRKTQFLLFKTVGCRLHDVSDEY